MFFDRVYNLLSAVWQRVFALVVLIFFTPRGKTKKQSAKEASNIFHNIMQRSVKDNPKPESKKVSS